MSNELINRFKYLFEYDNGKLIRRVPRGNSKKGDHCGHVEKKGYRSTEVDGKAYKNHRIIFSMIYDFIPKYIDHIDGNRLNNNINNLRSCDSSQNGMNRKLSKRSTSMIKGVYWRSDVERWSCRIGFKGRRINLGFFDKKIDAAIAYDNKAIELFGQFAKTNKTLGLI